MRTSCKAMKPRSQIDVFEEIIVDSFAGGGGASTGIELATGRVVDVAINHDPDAILMHRTNHHVRFLSADFTFSVLCAFIKVKHFSDVPFLNRGIVLRTVQNADHPRRFG